MEDNPEFKNQIDIPVECFIRITKYDNEYGERAKFILKRKDGIEIEASLVYEDMIGDDQELTVAYLRKSE